MIKFIHSNPHFKYKKSSCIITRGRLSCRPPEDFFLFEIRAWIIQTLPPLFHRPRLLPAQFSHLDFLKEIHSSSSQDVRSWLTVTNLSGAREKPSMNIFKKKLYSFFNPFLDQWLLKPSYHRRKSFIVRKQLRRSIPVRQYPVPSCWDRNKGLFVLWVPNRCHSVTSLDPAYPAFVLRHFKTSHHSSYNAQRVLQICFAPFWTSLTRRTVVCNQCWFYPFIYPFIYPFNRIFGSTTQT